MAARGSVSFPRRGEVYFVDFNPTVGAEIQKRRPALVLQNDLANRASPLTIVAALSSRFDRERRYPTEVLVHVPEGGLSADSVVLLNQVRTVDKRRLGMRLGRLKAETMAQIDNALRVSFGLTQL